MRRADRLFQIVLQLGRSQVVTAQQMAGRLAVSERTIYRDIRDLVASGVPIAGEAGVGYCMRSGYQVPPMMFDADELQALVFGADVAKSWGDAAMAEAADRILQKIDAVLPQELRPTLNHSKLMVPDCHRREAFAEALGIARHAINGRSRLYLDYRDVRGEISERIIWPLALLYWGNTWTVGGWCELRQAFRTFRLDRVQGLRQLASTFPDEAGRRLNDYLRCAVHSEEPTDSPRTARQRATEHASAMLTEAIT